MSAPRPAPSKPAEKLIVGMVLVLASIPLAFFFIFWLFAVLFFFGGLIIYIMGLEENRKREKAKKEAAVPPASHAGQPVLVQAGSGW